MSEKERKKGGRKKSKKKREETRTEMSQNSDNNIIFHTIYTETIPTRVHTRTCGTVTCTARPPND
jgi:hypothetical protein